MTRASKLSERMGAVAAHASAQVEAPRTSGPPEPRTSGTVSTKRVRLGVDLLPGERRALRVWCLDAADRLGRVEVPAAAVLAALLDELHDDDELGLRIVRRLAAESTS